MTALDAKVRATGLIAYKAAIDHAIENGLQAPASIDLGSDSLNLWITGDPTKWIDSIHVDDTRTREAVTSGHEIVYITGRLPLLGVKVQLRHSRSVVHANHLRAVTA